MSALEDAFRPAIVNEWHGPTTVAGIVAMLAESPALGTTDRERVRAFLSFPQSHNVPPPLRQQLEALIQGEPEEEEGA